MYEKELEIRGVSRNEVITYLQQLGATITTDHYCYQANGWICYVLKEDSFRMFHSDIPKVIVTFQSEDEETLTNIISLFRKKTFRAGG